MKKISQIFLVIFGILVLASCGSKKEIGPSIPQDFFGCVSMGQNKDDVCVKLKAQKFIMSDSPTAEKVRWFPNDSLNAVQFADRTWTRFTTYFMNNTLSEIRFYANCGDDKSDAKVDYKKLKEKFEEKYG